MAVNIRKFVLSAHSLDELVALGTLTPQVARFLEASVAAGLNILVSGGTQAGKTTLLNCLAAAIPPQERVVTAEEVFELKIPLPDVVSLQCRQPSLEGTGEIKLRRLVKEALRMRPSRIIVGEVRQEESLDLLIGLNSGLPGMASIHANSAREAITKLCTLPLLAGDNVASENAAPSSAARRPDLVHGFLTATLRHCRGVICAAVFEVDDAAHRCRARDRQVTVHVARPLQPGRQARHARRMRERPRLCEPAAVLATTSGPSGRSLRPPPSRLPPRPLRHVSAQQVEARIQAARRSAERRSPG